MNRGSVQEKAKKLTTREYDQIEEMTGISSLVLIECFADVERNEALEVLKAALRRGESAGEWGSYCRQWARRNKRGFYRPGFMDGYRLTWEQTAHERRVRNGGAA
jgi:hypothetical protein